MMKGCQDRSSELWQLNFDILNLNVILSLELCCARRASNAVDACAYCFSSKRRLRHLTVAIGQTAYLMLPPKWVHPSLHAPRVCFQNEAGHGFEGLSDLSTLEVTGERVGKC